MPPSPLTYLPRPSTSPEQVRAPLRELAASLPARARRVIPAPDGSPYLTRFTLADLEDGGHLYLHWFHQSDPDRELHSHPWTGRGLILAGGYREERRAGDAVVERVFQRGDLNVLSPDTFHRVELLDVDCWTLFVAGPPMRLWGFWCRDTGTFTAKREFFARRATGGRA